MVDILVTRCAAQFFEVIRDYLRASHLFVALEAWHRDVTSVQYEVGLLVHREREACDLEGCSVMALLAAVAPGRCGKLPFVLILVAIHAERIFDLEPRVFSRRNVARGALHLSVRNSEREARFRVICSGKGRRRPSLYRVAALAFSCIAALRKLPAMRVRLMAVSAEIVWHRSFEVATCMALRASDLQVFSQQRKVCRGVVERERESGFLPGRCVVTRIASLRECALVRVYTMAI